MNMWLDLRRIACVLSDALDLVGVDDVAHGKRVAYMAVRAAELMGFSKEIRDEPMYAALFHDCGVSSTREHRKLVDNLDWDGGEDHCFRGERLIGRFRPMSHLSDIVRWHHTHFVDLEKKGLPILVRQLSNLIYLADRMDALAAGVSGDILLAGKDIIEVIRNNSGTRFQPEAVRAMIDAASHENFWQARESRVLAHWLESESTRPAKSSISMDDLEDLGYIFATIVDARSPFTAEHSRGVSDITQLLSDAAGLPAERCRRVGLAALLHDIGKLRVPDRILDKPGGAAA